MFILFAQMLGDSYSVQQFLFDALRTVNGFLPYILPAGIIMGLINWVYGAALRAFVFRG